MSDQELRTMIRDAELELASRARQHEGAESQDNRGQRAFVADLANRPVMGFDLETLKSFYGLDFTSELTVSGLVYAAFSAAHSESGSSKPLKTFASALRIRTLLTLEGLRVPWQMKADEFPDFRQFIAHVRGVPVSAIDADYLAQLSGRVPSVTVRWLKNPDRYPVVGPTARWFAFVRWVLECYAPSERAAVLDKILGLVALELAVRARAGLGEESGDGDDSGEGSSKASGRGKRARGRGAKVP